MSYESVDGNFDIHWGFVNGYVQIVKCVVLFYFLGKLKVWMELKSTQPPAQWVSGLSRG